MYYTGLYLKTDCHSSAMVSILSWIAEGHGLDIWPGQKQGIKVGICLLCTQHFEVRAKTCRFRVKLCVWVKWNVFLLTVAFMS